MPNAGLTFQAEVFGDETIAKLLDTFGDSATDTRNRALIMVYLRCQLRCSEALDLRLCDINREAGSITVLKGKGGKRRVVGVDKDTLKSIDAWLAVRPHDSELVFTTHTGGRIHNSYVRKFVKRHAKKAGILQRVHVHGFRHTGACKLAKSGVDIRVISRQLGHSSLAVTSRYLDHLTADDVVNAVKDVEW